MKFKSIKTTVFWDYGLQKYKKKHPKDINPILTINYNVIVKKISAKYNQSKNYLGVPPLGKGAYSV
jgi:hypothetical protein